MRIQATLGVCRPDAMEERMHKHIEHGRVVLIKALAK